MNTNRMGNMNIPQKNEVLHGFQIPIYLNTDENNDDNPILLNYGSIIYDVSNLFLYNKN